MESIKSIGEERGKSIADSLIDGLVAGIIAGTGMGVILILVGWALGGNPAAILNSFVPWDNPTPVTGALLHIAVSSVYGMVFGALVFIFSRLWSKFPIWISAIVYGAVLYLLARFVVLPGVASQLQTIPTWLFALSHLAYGGLLGWWMTRQAG